MAFMPFGANALNVASARIERQELPVHKNRMFIDVFRLLGVLVPMPATINDGDDRQHDGHLNEYTDNGG